MNTASAPVISASHTSDADAPQVIVYTFTALLIYDVCTVSETHPAGQLVTLTFHISFSACLFHEFFIGCSQAATGSGHCKIIKEQSTSCLSRPGPDFSKTDNILFWSAQGHSEWCAIAPHSP